MRVRTAAMHGEQLQSTSSVVIVRGHHVYKNVWTPSIGERLQLRRQDDYDDHAVNVAREGRDYSRPRSPRDVTHILELHYQGVVTYAPPVEAFATGIKNFDRRNWPLIA